MLIVQASYPVETKYETEYRGPQTAVDVGSADATSDSTFDRLFGAKAATSSAYHALVSPITEGTGKGDLSAQDARNRKVDP